MKQEFPQLEYRHSQDKFLSDWWSYSKIFKGYRGSGKTTVLLCEMKRFFDSGYQKVGFFAPTQKNARNARRKYKKTFGEDVPEGKFMSPPSLRGLNLDVVLIDGGDVMPVSFWRDIGPMTPDFIRASSGLREIDGMGFDSEYRCRNSAI